MQSMQRGEPFHCLTDEELMARVADRDLACFNVIFNRYYKQIFNFIKKNVHDFREAEDITQEVFLRIYKSAGRFDTARKFSSWIYKIAFNEIKRHYSKVSGKRTSSINEPLDESSGGAERGDLLEFSGPNPEMSAEIAKNTQQIKKLIETLPEKQRTVVILKVYQELTFEEIAQILDCPLSTVLSRMRYAVKKLHNMLNGGGGDG
ncbi:MAG: sigma-70 family RNA polymerase sigma factor [bacterium]|jgi:RNA polymerase sigma-70 factor (ECF subfamily)